MKGLYIAVCLIITICASAPAVAQPSQAANIPVISTEDWRQMLGASPLTPESAAEKGGQIARHAEKKINGGDLYGGLLEGVIAYALSQYASDRSAEKGSAAWNKNRLSILRFRDALEKAGVPSSTIEQSARTLGEIASADEPTGTDQDNRTPFERYEGALLGNWLICTLEQKKIYLIKKAEERGVALDPEISGNTSLSTCIQKGLIELKSEYTTVLSLVKNDAGKKALLDHYVAAILQIKGTIPVLGEGEDSYMARQNMAKKKTDDLWVRFEITQP